MKRKMSKCVVDRVSEGRVALLLNPSFPSQVSISFSQVSNKTRLGSCGIGRPLEGTPVGVSHWTGGWLVTHGTRSTTRTATTASSTSRTTRSSLSSSHGTGTSRTSEDNRILTSSGKCNETIPSVNFVFETLFCWVKETETNRGSPLERKRDTHRHFSGVPCPRGILSDVLKT